MNLDSAVTGGGGAPEPGPVVTVNIWFASMFGRVQAGLFSFVSTIVE